MALTWENGSPPAVIPSYTGVVLNLYPLFDVTTGLSSQNPLELQRAPDVAGSPGTPETVTIMPPIPARGQVFIDPRPMTTDVWWYRHRHVIANGAGVGTWSDWQAATVQPLVPGEGRYDSPPAMQASMANPTSRYLCEVYTNSFSVTSGGLHAITMNNEYTNVGPLHDLGTNPSRITIPAVNNKGVWLFTMQIGFPAHATGARSIQLLEGGGVFAEGPGTEVVSGAQPVVLAFSEFSVDPAPGTYYELAALQTSGVSLNVSARISVVHIW